MSPGVWCMVGIYAVYCRQGLQCVLKRQHGVGGCEVGWVILVCHLFCSTHDAPVGWMCVCLRESCVGVWLGVCTCKRYSPSLFPSFLPLSFPSSLSPFFSPYLSPTLSLSLSLSPLWPQIHSLEQQLAEKTELLRQVEVQLASQSDYEEIKRELE